MDEFNLTKIFAGRYDQLTIIAGFIRQAANAAGFDEAATNLLETAVDEACSNIIEHAYGGENIGNITCTCRVDTQDLTVILRDTGKVFTPECIPTPDIKAPLKKRKAHGLGLYFIRQIMDEICFDFNTNEGNLMIMKKHRGCK